jgi:hypothetical protein
MMREPTVIVGGNDARFRTAGEVVVCVFLDCILTVGRDAIGAGAFRPGEAIRGIDAGADRLGLITRGAAPAASNVRVIAVAEAELKELERRALPKALSVCFTSGEGYVVLVEGLAPGYSLLQFERGRAEPVSSSLGTFSRVPALRWSVAGLVGASNGGDLIAFDRDLQVRWRRPSDPEIKRRSTIGGAVVAQADRVLWNQGSDSGLQIGVLGAYALSDGHELWRYRFPGELSFTEDGGLLYCVSGGCMWILDSATGEASVCGARAVDKGDPRDAFWSDGTYLWYASGQENEIHVFTLQGDKRVARLKVPEPFGLQFGVGPAFTQGWTYLALWCPDVGLKGALSGWLRIPPGSEVPSEIKVESYPRHRMRTVPNAAGEAYRIALKAESFEDQLRFGHLLLKATAKVHGDHRWEDPRRNPKFTGLMQLATDLGRLSADQCEALQKVARSVEEELAYDQVMAGDRSGPIRVEVVQLETGELDGPARYDETFVATYQESPDAPAAEAEDSGLPEEAVEALKNAGRDPVLRLGLDLVLLVAAAAELDWQEQRSKVDAWLQRRYGESVGFTQGLVFHTGLLLTTPDIVRQLFPSGEELMVPHVWKDVTAGVLQLGSWVNSGEVSVSEALESVAMLRGLVGQLTGGKAKARAAGKKMNSVLQMIEKAFTEVERQLRRQH